MDTIQNGLGIERPRAAHGRFAPGQPGRRKGVIDKRARTASQFAAACLAKHPDIVDSFLRSTDERIRLDCFKFLFEYQHGKPLQRVEFEMRSEATRYAAELGVPTDELLAAADAYVERMAAN